MGSRPRALAEDPRPTQAKRLKGIANYFRLLVGDYGVIYYSADDTAER